MSDLFSIANTKSPRAESTYSADDIEVLEGLEPVRRRPGMYIGGTDESALHHLVAEVLDNAMDEAVAGYASFIKLNLNDDGSITVEDNGRGIPIDKHPKYPDKSAVEVILTTLHSGGKFSNKSYSTAGGLHGVGISVVNALSSKLLVKIYRNKKLYTQEYARGAPVTELTEGPPANKRGTIITFYPDEEIFGEGAKFNPKKLYDMAKSKAYLYKGVEIHWSGPVDLCTELGIPIKDVIHFPKGVEDYIRTQFSSEESVVNDIFTGEAKFSDGHGRIEWAIAFVYDDGFINSYCNTITTPLGGTHEQGFKGALIKSIRSYGEMLGTKKTSSITIDDITQSARIIISLFITNPVFQGQTKEKLVSQDAQKLVESNVKDHFDHWLANNKASSDKLIEHLISCAEERLNKKNSKQVTRKNLLHKLRLPGKLADCSSNNKVGTELFIVEGDSAGGSAKQARNRDTQAILPIRGKILNVASSAADRITQNQEIQDLEIALACGVGNNYKGENLRYEKIIIMTDADVDGSHIAALLMTFFYLRMPKLVKDGHLYLARPPLFRLTQSGESFYAADDKAKDEIISKLTKKSKAKIEIGRFKGLGEMTAQQLKQTTMDPKNRTLIKVKVDELENAARMVDDLMGKKPEKRFQFIYEQALTKMDLIINNLDV